MLARRPLLVYAIAAMAGIVWARYYPAWIGWTAMAACIVFVCLTAWYLLTPYPLRPPPESLPEEYRPHILPVPGFFARRGLNRFMLITSLVCLLLGMARQWRHGEDMAAERLPETDFFTATFIPLSPRTDYPGQEEWWRVPALLVSVGGEPADGIRVRLTGRAGPDFRRGDLVSARVRKEYVPVRAFPHAFDPRFWLERDRQAAGLAVVRSRENAAAYQVVLLDDVSTYTRVRRALDAIRAVAIGKTLQYGGEAGGLLAAMLYGYRREIAEPVRDSFRRVGIGHVLAISGLHVGLIVMLLWWLSGLWSWSGRWRAIACLILVLAYLCLSGGQVAASRASFMAVIHLAGIAWGRRADMLNSLGAAAFVIALRNPTAPLDIGFQLSFTAVFFIHLSRPEPIPDPEMEQERRRKKLLSPWQRFARHLRAKVFSLIRLSIYTWIGLFPIIALIFNQINLIGLPINVLVIPWMGAVLAAGLLLPIFGWIPGASWLLCLPAEILTITAMAADRAPYSSIPCHMPSLAWIAAFYLISLLLSLYGMFSRNRTRRMWIRYCVAALAVSCVGLIASMASAPPPPGGRIAVLSTRGSGMIAAESEQGGIALIGSFYRGGLAEAGWLHHLRRAGPVTAIALTRPPPDGSVVEDAGTLLSALQYHYDVHAITIPLTDAEADLRVNWHAVPDAPGVEYALSRDARGKVVWLTVRTGDRSVCVATSLAGQQLPWRLRNRIPGYDAKLVLASFVGKTPAEIDRAPPGRCGLIGDYAKQAPPSWFRKADYGAIVLTDSIFGYDGNKWLEIPAGGATPPENMEQ